MREEVMEALLCRLSDFERDVYLLKIEGLGAMAIARRLKRRVKAVDMALRRVANKRQDLELEA